MIFDDSWVCCCPRRRLVRRLMRRLARCPVRRLSAAGLHWAWQEHEVWQRGDPSSVRVVLLIRFWHPDIPSARYPEVFHHMKAQYIKHKRRLTMPPLRRNDAKVKPHLNAPTPPAGLV